VPALRDIFARREFNAIGMDETGSFRLLPCFVRPLPCSDPSFKSLGDIAISVAQIPLKTWVIPASNSPKFESNHNDEEAHLFTRGSTGLAGGAGTGIPGNQTNSFHSPILSPSSMILNRRGKRYS
jgi:hypothetical protein